MAAANLGQLLESVLGPKFDGGAVVFLSAKCCCGFSCPEKMVNARDVASVWKTWQALHRRYQSIIACTLDNLTPKVTALEVPEVAEEIEYA